MFRKDLKDSLDLKQDFSSLQKKIGKNVNALKNIFKS